MIKRNTRLIAGLMAVAFIASTVVTQPSVASAAAKKTVTVKTQKQLDAALKDKKVTDIVIKTSKNVALKIKDGDYGKKTLTVTSPKATINNYGDFKKISVNDGKSFTDRGEGNNILVKDKNSLKLVTGKQSSDTKITVSTSAKGGKINIVNNGSIDAIKINGKSTVTVGGNSKDAPTITNNATGAKIVASMDATIVLDKKATLSVKEGVTLESLTVNANANITVAKGASVGEVVVAGNASDVALNVNGTVASVTVDTKADVAVSGSTTQTVAITNNAEGATIKAEVKTNVTLNADAKINLDKGAEGSSVTAGNENVKPDVTNNTSEEVKVTDSNGKDTTVESGKSETTTPDTKPSDNNTSGGDGGGSSSSGGSPKPPAVTVTVTLHTTDATLDLGEVISASAICSNGSTDITYKWYVGDKVVTEGDTYEISPEAIGEKIKVVATAAGTTGSAQTSTAVRNPVYHDEMYTPLEVCVTSGTAIDTIVQMLGTDVGLYPGRGDNIDGMSVKWSAPKGFNSSAPGVYTFTGKVEIDETKYVWDDPELAKTSKDVRVLGTNMVSYTIDVPETVDMDDNTEHFTVNNKAANLYYNNDGPSNFEYTIEGNYFNLDKFTFNGLPEGRYVGLTLTFNEDVNVSEDIYFGTTANNMALVSNEAVARANVVSDMSNAMLVYVDAEAAYYNPVTYYIKQGEDGDVTPIRFYGGTTIVTTREIKTSLNEQYFSQYDEFIPHSNLPSELTYAILGDDAHTATIPVVWVCDRPYNVPGDYVFKAIPRGDFPITISPMTTVNVKLTKIDKSSENTPEIPADELITHVGGSSVYFKDIVGYEYAVVKTADEIANATWKPDIDCITGLDPETDYKLAYRLAATETATACNYRIVDFITTRACFAPTETSVTSGEMATTISEGVNGLLDYFTYMLKENGEADATCPVELKWTSAPEYKGEVGTYVFTAAPVGDYRDIFDFSNVKWPVRKITVSEDEIVDPDPDPVKSCTGNIYLFGDTRIGTTGTEDAIPQEFSDGVTTLKPVASIKPVDGEYILPLNMVFVDEKYSIKSLSYTDKNGNSTDIILPFIREGVHLQFWVTLDKDAEDKVGAAFYMDYDGEGTKYTKSDLIKIDISGIEFLPAAPETPVIVATPSAIEGLAVYPMESTINTEKDYKIVKNSDGTSYSVTATLNYNDMNGFEGLDGEYSKGYFIPLRFTVPETVNASNVSLAVTGGAVSSLIYTTNSEEHTIELLVRSCKDQTMFTPTSAPCAISVDFDGEGTAWAPYVFTINEDNVVLDVPDGDPADLSIVSELPEGVELARAEKVCGCLSTRYADGTVTIEGDMQMDITSGNDKVQFFMHMLKGDNVGVAIMTADSATCHMFETGSDEVAVKDNDVWISKVIELNNSGQLSPDSQGAFTICMLEAGPAGTYTFAKEYNITVASKVYVSNPDEIM